MQVYNYNAGKKVKTIDIDQLKSSEKITGQNPEVKTQENVFSGLSSDKGITDSKAKNITNCLGSNELASYESTEKGNGVQKYNKVPSELKINPKYKADGNKNEGYLENAREETVSTKPTKEQQDVIDYYVQQALDKYPGDVTDKVSYKDEDGNVLKEVVKKTDEQGRPYTVTIEYDDKGRVSSVNAQSDDLQKADGEKTFFKYNSDGTIDISQDSGADGPDGSRVSNLIAQPSYKVHPDGTTTETGPYAHIFERIKKGSDRSRF